MKNLFQLWNDTFKVEEEREQYDPFDGDDSEEDNPENEP